MPSWVVNMPSPMANRTPRHVRGRIKMTTLRKPGLSTSIVICIYLSVVFFTGTSAQTCVTGSCSYPEVYGDGSPGFSPNLTCYDPSVFVNVTCSGNLYGISDIGPCVDVYWEYNPARPTCEESSCPPVTTPDFGSVSPEDTNSLYTVIEYECNGGRYLDGTSMAVCTGTGDWSPADVPTCSGNCSIPDVTNGEVTVSDPPLYEGIQIQIECDIGFTLTGPANVTCHDEEWTPEVIGECLADCNSPSIQNSDYSTDQGSINHGEYIIVNCDDGYTSGTGSEVAEPMTCSDGSWDDIVICYENCPNITASDQGMMYPSSAPFYHSDSVYFNCTDGYTLDGSSTAICNDGIWSSEVPTCQEDCAVPVVDNSNLNDTSGTSDVSHGADITVTCNDGYTFGYYSNFDGVLTCNNGSINVTGIACLESCDNRYIANSNWADKSGSTKYGGSIVVDCNEGFTSGSGQDQNETLECVGGTWDREVTCYANCEIVSAPGGGTMYPEVPTLYHNNSVFFNCTDTYLFVGEPLLVCSNGDWSDLVPDCKESCPPPDIANSTSFEFEDGDLTQHGEYVIVECDEGYTSGSGAEVNETLYCDDGSWNRTVYCYENCLDVTAPGNGNGESNPPNYHGNQANFTCNTNYTLDGDQTLTCDDGEWNSEFPECKADCGDPGTPVNGSQVNPVYTHGGQVTFNCSEGYDTLGASVITCNDGNWSAPIPTCEEKSLVDQITLSCNYDSYTVQIPMALLDGLKPGELVLEGNTSCAGSEPGDDSLVYITSALDGCGTILTETSTTDEVGGTTYYDVYTNRVIDYSSSGVVSGPSVNLPLTCTYNREQTLAMSYNLTNYVIAKSLSEDGIYKFQFLIYDDETFSDTISSTPYFVDLNEKVYFGISLLVGGGALRVSAQTCWATPSSSYSDDTRWDLITESCPKDANLDIHEDLTRALFSMNSFRFLDHDSLIYIHCDVKVCEGDSTDCNLPWDVCPSSGSHRRRRRSAANGGSKRLKRLRAGPIQWVKHGYSQSAIQRRDESVGSIPDSPMVYMIVIASLAGFCIMLIASLSVVTTKLLMKGKQANDIT